MGNLFHIRWEMMVTNESPCRGFRGCGMEVNGITTLYMKTQSIPIGYNFYDFTCKRIRSVALIERLFLVNP